MTPDSENRGRTGQVAVKPVMVCAPPAQAQL